MRGLLLFLFDRLLQLLFDSLLDLQVEPLDISQHRLLAARLRRCLLALLDVVLSGERSQQADAAVKAHRTLDGAHAAGVLADAQLGNLMHSRQKTFTPVAYNTAQDNT